MKVTELLRVLDDRIAGRVGAITDAHPDWPCRRGCDDCCRSLAHPPLLTEPEWRRIEPLLDDALRARVREMRGRVCPLLDEEAGACRVYQARPVACRTYGFFADREAGLYCSRIEARVESGEFSDVVWGNQEAVESTLDGLGVRRTMAEWIAEIT